MVTAQPIMGSLDNQQAWVPYETTKDCSQGFCSVYCPQWCYIIFPPPPPFTLDDESASASPGTAFSPLVIAIIGVLASAFLLVSYYTIISKYCGRFRRRQRVHRRPDDNDNDNNGNSSTDDEETGGQSRRHDTVWHVSTSNGLDEALISKIAVYSYKSGEGVVDGTDCSVCLGEFREDESLRLLPKCSHAFHLHCIDTWLKSHSNCPLCRANIVSAGAPPAPAPAPPIHSDELVIVIEDVEISREEEREESSTIEHKDPPSAPETSYDCANDTGDSCAEAERQIRRSFSDSSRHGRVSIADVLRVSMEDELLAAKDQGLWDGAGSSRRSGGEHGRSRGLHCVMSPVPMKRSMSSGRFCFNSRQGRWRNAVLPL